MRNLLLFSAAALAACGHAASGANTGGSAERRFVLAGVSLGMTPAQVAATLKAAGYAKGSEDLGYDFSHEVIRARGGGTLNDPRTAINKQNFIKQGQSVAVNYVVMPGGPVAEMVFYSVDRGLMSTQQVADELTRRFGASTYGSVWCSESSSDCMHKEAHVSVNNLGSFTAAILEDPTQATRQADAIRAAPGAQKATV